MTGCLALSCALAATPCWAQSVSSDQGAGSAQGTVTQAVVSQPDVSQNGATPDVGTSVAAGAPVVSVGQPQDGNVATRDMVAEPEAAPDEVSGMLVPSGAGQHSGHHISEEEPGIIVSSRPLAPDPAKAINMASFAVTQALDSAVLEPFSKGYEAVVPSPVRDGIHNVLYNLREPVIAANYLMQHKIGKTGETIARFVINSTIGLAGIFDMAKRKPFKLPFHENGFADTLGFYGVGNGPYIFMPLFGSTTLRDLAGRIVDRAALPTAIGSNVIPAAALVPMIVLGIVDRRLVNKERIKQERESADPYTTTRDNYLRRRAKHIDELRHPKGPETPPEE